MKKSGRLFVTIVVTAMVTITFLIAGCKQAVAMWEQDRVPIFFETIMILPCTNK